MAAIGVLDELRFAQARFALEEQLANLGRTVDQDAGRASEIESDDISVALGEGRQESEHVSPPGLVVESARVLASGARRWCRHQASLPSRLSAHDLRCGPVDLRARARRGSRAGRRREPSFARPPAGPGSRTPARLEVLELLAGAGSSEAQIHDHLRLSASDGDSRDTLRGAALSP